MTLGKLTKLFLLTLLVVLLMSVRLFESQIFQDPLSDYFHSDFQLYDLPNIEKWYVLMGTSLRYLINMVLSLWILWILFKRENYINAALWVYLFAFIILMLFFFFLLEADSSFMKMTLFYIRRFLIQPMLLLILIPGFYFLKTRERG